MTPQEIKTIKEAAYSQIEEANNKLSEIRAICKHENTFEGNWSWRIGCINPAIICDDCGNLVKYLDGWEPIFEIVEDDKTLEGNI